MYSRLSPFAESAASGVGLAPSCFFFCPFIRSCRAGCTAPLAPSDWSSPMSVPDDDEPARALLSRADRPCDSTLPSVLALLLLSFPALFTTSASTESELESDPGLLSLASESEWESAEEADSDAEWVAVVLARFIGRLSFEVADSASEAEDESLADSDSASDSDEGDSDELSDALRLSGLEVAG
jgi:hypothetical protein